MNAQRLISFAVVPGILVAVSTVAMAAFEAWVLSRCDSKFGCSGGVEFAAMIGATGGVASIIGCAIAAVFQRISLSQLSVKGVALSIVITALILIAAFPFVPGWPFEGLGLVLGWCTLSFAMSSVVLFGARHAHA